MRVEIIYKGRAPIVLEDVRAVKGYSSRSPSGADLAVVWDDSDATDRFVEFHGLLRRDGPT